MFWNTHKDCHYWVWGVKYLFEKEKTHSGNVHLHCHVSIICDLIMNGERVESVPYCQQIMRWTGQPANAYRCWHHNGPCCEFACFSMLKSLILDILKAIVTLLLNFWNVLQFAYSFWLCALISMLFKYKNNILMNGKSFFWCLQFNFD